MTADYPIPAGRHRTEFTVRRSRFIATADFTPSVEAARAFIQAIRGEFPDATHNVYAFAVGFGPSVIHGLSDDGEPAGTAGRPALAVVQGSGLGDVCVVITRYFGGAKLGTGGLVRAYTRAAQEVLAGLPRTQRVDWRTVSFRVPYRLYEPVTRLVAAHQGQVREETFGPEIALEVRLPADRVEAFGQALMGLTAGRVAPKLKRG